VREEGLTLGVGGKVRRGRRERLKMRASAKRRGCKGKVNAIGAQTVTGESEKRGGKS